MKYIFLDLDGVLNIYSGKNPTFKTSQFHFEPKIVELFNNFLSKNKEKLIIIISSSWRDDMEDMKSELKKSGFKYEYLIKGRTELSNKSRGEQIKNFVEENEIKDYLVIDDVMEDIKENISEENLVETKSDEGITTYTINKLQSMFI